MRYRCGGPGHEAHIYHLSPAPSERAIVARSDTATVKRARFAFTAPPQKGCIPALDSGNRAVFLRKIPGFASPPLDGFAVFADRTATTDLAVALFSDHRR